MQGGQHGNSEAFRDTSTEVRAPAWLIVVALSAGCGPIEYVNTVTRSASNAVSSARAADAEKLSPYWWTRAVEYLHQARVLAAHSDFQAANRFGRRATEAANKAREEALAGGAPKPPGEEAAPAATPTPTPAPTPAPTPTPTPPPAPEGTR